ncbi:leucine-rich PPR motif-containing protein, mitochondrial [Anthonomus grandis grandis]|uniref:leucine-rich PPR motif-containing protein, mitochondrial n=1 Tax=Anthonomus grandis grandis TaxID=2921223 RepID=UPI0021652714|nr:leucine-rich PPR motif-containing protein, mitochondrial [Anthonomus grandis grandis]
MFRCIGLLGRLVHNDLPGHIGLYSKVKSLRVNNLNIQQQSVVRFCDQLRDSNASIKTTKKVGFNINDLLSHINSGKTFYLKQLKNVFHTIKFDTLKSEDAELLLKCCGSLIPDSSRIQRNALCQEVFNGLKQADNLNTGIINRYIKTCTENNCPITDKEFVLKSQPNYDTYKLLLENVSQFGNVQEVLTLLEVMKTKEISLGSEMVNSLILAHTINGGLKSAQAVLDAMRLVHMSDNYYAKLNLLKGLIRRKDLSEFKLAAVDYHVSLTEEDFLDFIEELGVNKLDSWLDETEKFYKHIPINRDLQLKIEKICIHLVHMEQPRAAMNIYKRFVEPQLDVYYGYCVLKEMLHCEVDIKHIINEAKDLIEKDLNPYILESLTELALKFKYTHQAWELLRSLNTLRPHYFWPLLIQAGNERGEIGVLSTLKTIKEFNVKLNAETLEHYILPYCDVANFKLLIIKLQAVGFTVKEIVSPLLGVLLQQKKTKRAADLCRNYNVEIFGENFIYSLAKAWTVTKDSVSVITLFARYCESNRSEGDIVGNFLITILKSDLKEFRSFIRLIQLIGKQRLRISPQSAEVVREMCSDLVPTDLRGELESALHSVVDLGLNFIDEVVIPHPKNMDIDGLESHLIELQAKKMETRGVLRKLIQMHAGKGDVHRVRQLRRLFLESGYEESAGIKSSIMHSYVLANQLEEALRLYEELLSLHPTFSLDSFKFIDLVKLLIENDRFEEGRGVLENELSRCKKNGNPSTILRNCRELLGACRTPKEVELIFDLLIRSGVCAVNNVILGPLVRIHITRGNIDKAVNKYVELAKKYKCTPLQLEVFRQVINLENGEQLEQVLNATIEVHGVPAAHVGLIAALAENGQENALRKFLANIKHPIAGLLQNRCKRWVQEHKVEPLICLAKAFYRLPREIFDVGFIYNCIFDVFDITGDYEEASAFFEQLPEEFKNLNMEKYFRKITENRNAASKL